MHEGTISLKAPDPAVAVGAILPWAHVRYPSLPGPADDDIPVVSASVETTEVLNSSVQCLTAHMEAVPDERRRGPPMPPYLRGVRLVGRCDDRPVVVELHTRRQARLAAWVALRPYVP